MDLDSLTTPAGRPHEPAPDPASLPARRPQSTPCQTPAFESRASATPGNREESAMRTHMAQSFGIEEVSALRHAVARYATRCGLMGRRLEDFVLAVHESVINAVVHTGGRGHLTLWTADGLLRAETIDHGTGIPGSRLESHDLPGPSSFDGRGIFLIRRLCDGVTFSTGPHGTRVEIIMKLPDDRAQRRSSMRRVRVAAPGPGRHLGDFTA